MADSTNLNSNFITVHLTVPCKCLEHFRSVITKSDNNNINFLFSVFIRQSRFK